MPTPLTLTHSTFCSMASSSRMKEELLIRKKNWPRNHKSGNRGLIINTSPHTTPVWIEPNSKTTTTAASAVVPARKVPVLYYLSRNGHLEHPHLVDVTLSSPHGLYLRGNSSDLYTQFN